MGAVFYLILVFMALSFWDLAIKIRMIFGVSVARRYMDAQSVRISRILFRMAQMYAKLNLIVETPLVTEYPDQFVVIANHQSLADIPLLIQMFPHHRVRFVAKRSLSRYLPLVSPLLRYQRHALISRSGDLSSTYRSIRRLALSSAHGIVPVVFPEGTRSKTGVVGAFHEGAARILLQIHSLPVVTVAIDGGHVFSRITAVIRRIRGATYRCRVTSIRPAPGNKQEIVSLLTECRQEIIEQQKQWRAEK
ncbi:lysophospholipid acyltransferase family protein [Salinispira pacifica]